jgi:hypothetical protein
MSNLRKNMKSKSKRKQSQSTRGNIYDIISFYNNDDTEPSHTNEVILKIEKSNQRINRDKWIKFKLFGCLIINILLSAPVYSYGTIYLLQKRFFDSQPLVVWPPILLNSVFLIVTPWLFNSISTPSSRNSRSAYVSASIFAKLSNRAVIIIFSTVLSLAVCVAGFSFSNLNANFAVIFAFFSVIGGNLIYRLC